MVVRFGWLVAMGMWVGCAGEPMYATGAGPGDDTPSTCATPTAVPEGVRTALALSPAFYARHCSALGIDVLASEAVSDAVLEEAGRIVEGVLGERPDLRDALHDRFFRVVLVASSAGEHLSDVPELRGITPTENAAAGLGPDPRFPAATIRDSVIACRLSNQDPLATPPGDTLVHELGHAVLDMGLAEVDPGFLDRLRTAYEGARRAGTWQLELGPGVRDLGVNETNYLMTNADEYWATGVSAWFGFKPIPLGYELTDASPPALRLRVLYGRDALRDRDPDLAALLEEVFGPAPALTTRCRDWVPKVGG